MKRAILFAVLLLLACCVVAHSDARNYDRALANVLVHEGGFSNHPADPGKATLQGITQARYDQFREEHGLRTRVLVPGLLKDATWPAERAAIYKVYYADEIRFDELPRGLDYAVFDYAVNSGPGRAGKVLRCVLQVAHPVDECVRISRTWTVTDPIIEALQQADVKHVIREVYDERRRFIRRLSTYKTFGKGWERRLNSGQPIALIMTTGARADSFALRPELGPGKAEEADEVAP